MYGAICCINIIYAMKNVMYTFIVPMHYITHMHRYIIYIIIGTYMHIQHILVRDDSFS